MGTFTTRLIRVVSEHATELHDQRALVRTRENGPERTWQLFTPAGQTMARVRVYVDKSTGRVTFDGILETGALPEARRDR